MADILYTSTNELICYFFLLHCKNMFFFFLFYYLFILFHLLFFIYSNVFLNKWDKLDSRIKNFK